MQKKAQLTSIRKLYHGEHKGPFSCRMGEGRRGRRFFVRGQGRSTRDPCLVRGASRKIRARSLSSGSAAASFRKMMRHKGRRRRREDEKAKEDFLCCRVSLASPSPYLSGGKMFLPMGAFQTVLRPCDATGTDGADRNGNNCTACTHDSTGDLFQILKQKFLESWRHVIACQEAEAQPRAL